jgi:hypothetical protein
VGIAGFKHMLNTGARVKGYILWREVIREYIVISLPGGGALVRYIRSLYIRFD